MTASTLDLAASITRPADDCLISLRSSGVLVSIQITSYTGVITDKSEGADLASRKGADGNAVAVIKKLFANSPEFRRLSNVRQTVYNGLEAHSCGFRWPGGWYYLPTSRLPKYMEWEEQMQALHAERLREFLAVYPSIRSDAAFQLGDLFDSSDFPEPEALAKRYAITCLRQPVPESDFSTALAREAAEDLRKHYLRQTQQVVEGILGSQIERLREVMQSLAHCCTLDTKVNKKGETVPMRRKLHEGTLEKALELVDHFRGFNPAGSHDLEDIRRDLEQALQGVTIDALRESDSMRARVGQDVSDILSKFGMAGA
jgi:hypothetical protein